MVGNEPLVQLGVEIFNTGQGGLGGFCAQCLGSVSMLKHPVLKPFQCYFSEIVEPSCHEMTLIV